MGKNVIAVSVINETDSEISNLDYQHRYDSDVYNLGHLDQLAPGDEKVVGEATFWTGFGRTGYDYWWVQFDRDGKRYTCKSNFYCYLTSSDADHLSLGVKLILTKDKMVVRPPVSSSCSVSLYESDELLRQVTEDHEKSGLSTETEEDESKKYCLSVEAS